MVFNNVNSKRSANIYSEVSGIWYNHIYIFTVLSVYPNDCREVTKNQSTTDRVSQSVSQQNTYTVQHHE